MTESAPLERIRKWWVVFLVGAVFGLVFVILGVRYFIETSIHDAYAQKDAANLLIQYMQVHEGQWPADWDSLEQLHSKGGSSISLDGIKSRIFIDFSADPKDLEKRSIESEDVTFDVIHARWPSSMVLEKGPNAQLYLYFRRKAGIAEPPPSVNKNGSSTVEKPERSRLIHSPASR